MAAVIAARFDSFANANSAAHALFAYGVPPDAVSVFFAPEHFRRSAEISDLDHDPRGFGARFYGQMNVATLAMLGALLGAAPVFSLGGPTWAVAGAAAAGAFVGSWTGAVWLADKARAQRDERVRRHALLTAQVPLAQEQEVIELLLDAGSENVERARGRWLHGQWIDADPPARMASGLRRRAGERSVARAGGRVMQDRRNGLERGLL